MTTPRPTRAESDARRSETTRQRLLDAAYGCLVELGYAGTTTVEICRRAGAPRGTLLHHFPNRDDLMLAAVGYVLDRQVAEFDAAFARIQRRHTRTATRGATLPIGDVIDQLWKVVSGPTMHVWLELLVAARTDQELQKRFKAQMRQFDDRIRQTYRSRLSDPGDPAATDLNISFAFAVLNGLSLDLQHKPRSQVLPVLEAFKDLAANNLAMGAVQPK